MLLVADLQSIGLVLLLLRTAALLVLGLIYMILGFVCQPVSGFSRLVQDSADLGFDLLQTVSLSHWGGLDSCRVACRVGYQ